MLLEDVLHVFEALERAGVRYAVFGGLAMAAHGFDRATRDLDLFLPPDEVNVQRLKDALHKAFDDPDVEGIHASDLAGAYPAIRYAPPNVDYTIDLVSRLGDAFAFEDLDVERVSAASVTINVVSPETLFRMKRNTIRLRDRDDAMRLARAFGFSNEEDA